MDVDEQVKKNVALIDEYMGECFKKVENKDILEAMEYSIFSGGKRLRPLIMLTLAEAYGVDKNKVLPFAAAIEMIHCYSLIHDDLPAMDNDDLRRGKPTNHKVFGEAMAILAGDALLNFAHETMLSYSLANFEEKNLKATYIISSSAGANGMIGGQVEDILSENKEIDLETLNYIHRNKTGKIIEAAFWASAVISNVPDETVETIKEIGRDFGLAFQIQDDILDSVSTTEVLGKPVGSDEKNKKLTYVKAYGVKSSKQKYNDICIKIETTLKELFCEENQFTKFIIKCLERIN